MNAGLWLLVLFGINTGLTFACAIRARQQAGRWSGSAWAYLATCLLCLATAALAIQSERMRADMAARWKPRAELAADALAACVEVARR